MSKGQHKCHLDKTLGLVAAVFKPWIVRRSHGGCQVLLPLSELDDLVSAIVKIVIEKSGGNK
uniref:Uncharacterized protein n=1 Tax=viral metagenome TaxID=1070528 RepID=A0A6M3KTA1_9ZZZZ